MNDQGCSVAYSFFFSFSARNEEDGGKAIFLLMTGGYKLRILLYPRGFGKGEGTHLSIGMHIFDNGEFDQILSRSKMSGNIEIALLSQQEDKTDLAKSLNDKFLHDMLSGGLETFILREIAQLSFNDMSLDNLHKGWGISKVYLT